MENRLRIVALVVAVGVSAAGSTCHKSQLEEDALRECDQLGHFQSWDDWDSHFGCYLARPQDTCRELVCDDGGCRSVYPACNDPWDVGSGSFQSRDGWVYGLRVWDYGNSADPSTGNWVLRVVNRGVHFIGCTRDFCTPEPGEEYDTGNGAHCPMCWDPPARDFSTATDCCVKVEISSGRSLDWRFGRDRTGGLSCQLANPPHLEEWDAGYMDPRVEPAECAADLGVLSPR